VSSSEVPRSRSRVMVSSCASARARSAASVSELISEIRSARYNADAEAAKKLATEPLGPLPDGLSAAEAAAWTAVANVLLNLDGVLMKG
jgi:NADPH:quinone reductase-like Zn-dependent oxidoreductase